MRKLQIINPGYQIECWNCDQYEYGVIVRRLDRPQEKLQICGRCLALALQEITKQGWLNQWILWQANSKLGEEIQLEKRFDKAQRKDRERNRDGGGIITGD